MPDTTGFFSTPNPKVMANFYETQALAIKGGAENVFI